MRLTYLIYRLASSFRYRLGRRLTPAGWLTLVGLAVTGFVGIDLDQSAASQTFAVLFCLLVIAALRSFLFRGRFDLERALPRFASVGLPFAYRITVRNRAARPWRDLEVFDRLADPRPSRKEFAALRRARPPSRSFRLTAQPPATIDHRRAVFKPSTLPLLPPQGQADAQFEALPLKRGPLRFIGADLAQCDPLGLVRGFVGVKLPQTVLILPKRYPVPAMALPGRHKYQQGGVAFAASVGESEEFVSVRDYRPGDPLRHVHWRSTARTGRLVVKEFEDEFFMRHALVLDTFGSPCQSDAFEEAVSVAASFACTVDTQESLLDLMFVGAQAVCFTTGRGVARAEQALELLASVQLCHEKSFTALQSLVLQHAPLLSGCICIFLAWDEPRRELARKLSSIGLPLQVLVIADEATAKKLRETPPDPAAGAFHILEIGKIEADLQALPGDRSSA